MNSKQFQSLTEYQKDMCVFDVDYSTILLNEISINDIVFLSNFEYKYNAKGDLLNFPLSISNRSWNQSGMYIYNF